MSTRTICHNPDIKIRQQSSTPSNLCFPYGIDEGPCIFDDECKDNLFCGYKNCPATFGNDDSNCCGLMQFKSPNYPNNYFNNVLSQES